MGFGGGVVAMVQPIQLPMASMARTADSGFVLVGESTPGVLMIRTDSAGNIQWNRTFGPGLTGGAGMDVVSTSDGGFAIACRRERGLIKTDSNGIMQWNKTYASWPLLEAVVETGDGDYALAGIGDVGTGLIKTDSLGTVQWISVLGTGEPGWDLVKTEDGGFAIPWRPGGLFKTDDTGRTEGFYYGLAWVDSTPNSITLYRGIYDTDWNYVRVRVWKPKP